MVKAFMWTEKEKTPATGSGIQSMEVRVASCIPQQGILEKCWHRASCLDDMVYFVLVYVGGWRVDRSRIHFRSIVLNDLLKNHRLLIMSQSP